MHAYILQDWTTIQGASGVLTITQEEAGWLDLTPYQDAIILLDAKSSTATPTITFQTSPSKDEALFLPVASGLSIPTAGTASPTAISALMTTAVSPNVPLARWLRWQLTSSTGPWNACFRVLVSANSPGM